MIKNKELDVKISQHRPVDVTPAANRVAVMLSNVSCGV